MNILITGASSGFGLEAAKLFIQHGHTVIGLARRHEKLMEIKASLGENFYPLTADMQNLTSIKEGIENLPEPFDKIDVLINNAGLALNLKPTFDVDFADLATMIDVNIRGLTYITHLILPQMVERNDGYIINISSTAGNYPYYGSNVYGPTKAFVTSFSQNLRADLIGKNIRVTNVEPGLCSDTEFSNVRFKGDDDKAAAVYADVDAVTGKEIADILYWLTTQPKHLNVNRIEIMPTMQTFAGLTVYKDPK
ncbi:SDR family NAD(P)-dependent oxidoreductase [Ignatzschineria rhizosphaerae]|uniref:SDR family NAD(P)-dependent oxidoreductase n=1 Tax=Ignatzschineria rhizosphaerae TaxID=2923279 RepID=A0ABY3X1V6_9GAMM|nr:SDR family NAD(P)-dependent oxidoreductase [Ignatzschineria rhizosphaerae]UNM95447.1 SDR family NAD(P)-dependent oxidoreductase [Ignatzschineria rhizosphaerae]